MRDEETKTLTVELTGAQLSGAGVLNAIAEITGTDRDLLGKMGIRLTWERGRPVRELSVPLRAENGELGWHTEQVNVGEDGHVQIGEHVATPRHARAVNRVFQQADYHAPLRRRTAVWVRGKSLPAHSHAKPAAMSWAGARYDLPKAFRS